MKIEKMDLLVAVYIFCILVAELMGGKTFHVIDVCGFQLNASVGIFLIPVLFSINDMVIEVYGPDRARSIIRSSLFTVVLLIGFTMLAINIPPSAKFAPNEWAYDIIFSQSARISVASIIAFAAADFLDVAVFVRIKKAMGNSALWVRNNLSNFIAQLVDTVVFMTVAFYSFNQSFEENITFLLGLIIPYWLLKCSMSVIETPLVYIGVRWLKK